MWDVFFSGWWVLLYEYLEFLKVMGFFFIYFEIFVMFGFYEFNFFVNSYEVVILFYLIKKLLIKNKFIFLKI